MNFMKFSKKTPTAAILLVLAMLTISVAHAAQVATYNAIASRNNNFSMIDSTNALIGGSNKVAFTWDGTVFNASSDYTGPGSVSNATASSPDVFFSYLWSAHDIQIFGPGTYTFDATLGGGATESGTLSMTVGAGQLGAHMLFDWNGNNNIDVAIVWNLDSTYTGTMFIGSAADNPAGNSASTVFLLSSMDADSDGKNGIPMPAGGPFQFANANFNFKGPLAFTFNDPTGVPLSTATVSDPITVTGIGAAVTNNAGVTVSGGEYAISTDGGTTYGAYTTAAGTVYLNNKIKVRHTSSASNSTATSTTLKIGLHSDTFTSTTVAASCDMGDTTPDAFTFVNQTDVALSTVIESGAITVGGICTGTNTAISVSGGEYAVSTDGGTTYGSYTSSAGTVTRTNMVKVRHTSSAASSTNTSTTLTIGGVSGTFTSTTTAAAGLNSYSTTASEPESMPGCSISSMPVSVLERADWWLAAGFIAWLGLIRRRRQNRV